MSIENLEETVDKYEVGAIYTIGVKITTQRQIESNARFELEFS